MKLVDIAGGTFHPKINIFCEDNLLSFQDLQCISPVESCPLDFVNMNFSQTQEVGDQQHLARNTSTREILKTVPNQSFLKMTNMDSTSMSLHCSEAVTLANIDNLPGLQLGQGLLDDEIEGLPQNAIFEIGRYVDDFNDLKNLNALTPADWISGESPTIHFIPVLDELYSKLEIPSESLDKPSTSDDSQTMERLQQTNCANELVNIKMMDSDYETFHDLQTLLDLDTFDGTIETTTIHPNIDSPPILQTPVDIPLFPVASSSVGCTQLKGKDTNDLESDNPEEHFPPNKKIKVSQKSTHEKYVEMRKKNNIASRRSRQIRKVKEQEMEIEEVKLKKENKLLKLTVKDLEKKRDNLKSFLMRKLSGL